MSPARQPEIFTEDNFSAEVLESSQPVLVDFWADWCAPCRRIAPAVDRLANRYPGQLRVGKVDVDAQPELAQSYGIRSIPALLVFRDGEVVDRIAGVVPFEQLSASVERVFDAA